MTEISELAQLELGLPWECHLLMTYHTTKGEENISGSGYLSCLWNWEVLYLSGRSSGTLAWLSLCHEVIAGLTEGHCTGLH